MNGATIRVDLHEKFELSPYLYLQSMDPLGAYEGSVAMGWDAMNDRWKPDLIGTVEDLAPSVVRWGGCFSSYYKWKHGIGPREGRIPMVNLAWGGIETNQVGTHEFIDFCCQVGAEPLITVNLEADGRQHWANPPKGGNRSADAAEAAEWVDYCNNPSNAERVKNGETKPFGVKFWQLGNETSYDENGHDCKTAGRLTVAFAKAMRAVDPGIQLIAWGDSGWAREMAEVAGEHIDYLSFHHMIKPNKEPEWQVEGGGDPIGAFAFRQDPAAAWACLMDAYRSPAAKIDRIRSELDGMPIKLAKTEGHFSIKGRNRGEVQASWAAGVANARVLNVHERNGDILKIATHTDFFGTRWMCNAVIIPTVSGKLPPYLMPAAHVASLYRKHSGSHGIDVTRAPAYLDVTASRTGDTVYLHVVNTSFDTPVKTTLELPGRNIESVRVFEIDADPMFEIYEENSTELSVEEKPFDARGEWEFPSSSVTAMEIKLAG